MIKKNSPLSSKDRETLDNGTDTINRTRYMNFIINEFAYGFKRPLRETFIYLDEFGGLDFLIDNYDYQHTRHECDTILTLLKICRNNGGWL
ncbi:MAG: DUF3791 domain-containing protein [Marinilabiliaceae bacterium]|nr:DUF3791 domain-containing protein [Marinilabiliaceae bacterium]